MKPQELKENIKQLLEKNGWKIESDDPFEIRHIETNSFASNIAADYIVWVLVTEDALEDIC